MIEEASGIYDSNDGRGAAENDGEKGNKRKDDE